MTGSDKKKAILWGTVAVLGLAIVFTFLNSPEFGRIPVSSKGGNQAPVPGSISKQAKENSSPIAIPKKISTVGWLTYSDSKTGATFKYPENLGTTYISAADWPPKIMINNGTFSCLSAGKEYLPGGQTSPEMINGTSYCVTLRSGGAAGSIYNQYAFAFAEGEQEAILTFTIRKPQCENYPEPKMTQCKDERNSFDINQIADAMAGSVRL